MRSTLLALALLAATATAAAAPIAFKLDPNHTNVLATWSHNGFSNLSAHFGQVDGALVYDADNVGASRVDVRLPLAGLSSFVPALDEHLRGEDFFDAAKHPEVTFKSTTVSRASENHLAVQGELTIKGITKPVRLDVTVNKTTTDQGSGRTVMGFDATATIKRSEFGMDMAVPAVSDEIVLRISTEAKTPKTGS